MSLASLRTWAAALLIASLASAALAAEAAPAPKIQMAILLDTSNSMDGLIDQARSQVWRIVNELARARRDGRRPELQVALYEYGNNGLAKSQGYVRKVVPLTYDLDLVSESLFALHTPENGRPSEEYCGAAIASAVRDLAWDERDDALTCIFIAGNEPFSQGPVEFRVACKQARKRGICVSTIFCGPRERGIQEEWELAAELGGGTYLAIDPNQPKPAAQPLTARPGLPAPPVRVVASPHDAAMARMSAALNETYLPYGSADQRSLYACRQAAQDKLAAKADAVFAADRAGFKATGLYRNGHWDLVDAVHEKLVKVADLKPEELPESLRNLKPAEIEKVLAEKAAQRKGLQEEIQSLAKVREEFLARANQTYEKELLAWQEALRNIEGEAAREELAKSQPAKTLEQAVLEAIHKQAAAKNFRFE